jgi:hypothetical protein
VIRPASPEQPGPAVTVLAGDDCVRAAQAWQQQRWDEVCDGLADVAADAEAIERAYA